MKYLIVFLFIVTSCGPETRMFKRTFVIKNGLQIPITVNILINEELQISEDLLPNQKYIGEELETTVNVLDEPNGSSVATSIGGNVIEIIYNNKRKSISTSSDIDNGLGFFSEPVERNLLRTGNYEDVGNEESQFTITQQDFDNATPCDGPCE